MDIFHSTHPTSLTYSTILLMLLLPVIGQMNGQKAAKIINPEYDYVIVGTGSSSSSIADHFSKIPCVSVLLLKDCKLQPYVPEVPAITSDLWSTDLNYKPNVQRHKGRFLKKREVARPMQKMLVGSHNSNSRMFVDDNRKNYQWTSPGAEEWSYKSGSPYSWKTEDNRNTEYVMTDPFDYQYTMKPSQMCNIAMSYPMPSNNPTKLDILPNAIVRKVVVKNHRAVGVEFDFKDQTYKVKARRDVIMPLGYENTAHPSMFSSMGPRKELERQKIAPVGGLPIEQNPHDYWADKDDYQWISSKEPSAGKLQYPFNIAQYILNRTGALGSSEFLTAGNSAQNRPKEVIFNAQGVSEPEMDIQNTPEIAALGDLPIEQNLHDHCADMDDYEWSSSKEPSMGKFQYPFNIAQYIMNRTGTLGSSEFLTAGNSVQNRPKGDIFNAEGVSEPEMNAQKTSENRDVVTEMTDSTIFGNSSLLPDLMGSLMGQKNSPETARTFKMEYDYIIVGGGSAGSVVANRLSEVPCVSILLLEAGRSPPYISEVPAVILYNTDVDWKYKTTPQRYTGRLLRNRQVTWPSGKALGGSSILNAMNYARGNRKNYDNWEYEGANGWSFEDVFHYFVKLEDNRDPEYVANGYHGIGGPLTAHRPRYEAEIQMPIFQAAKSMGYKIVDSNAAWQTGFFMHQATLRAGQRCSTAKAYLVPAENRTNLDILPNAMVRKVVINNHQAVGVEFDFQGKTYVVKARREVIMSAGTVNTAQLLMLSGIGPRKELDRHKITVIADLPVGKNFHDHPSVNVVFELNSTIQPLAVKLLKPANILQYIQNRTGPLGSNGGITALAFLRAGIKQPRLDFPNFQLSFAETTAEFGLLTGLTPEAYAQVFAPYEGKPLYTCFSNIIQPRSRGTVQLQSADPYDPPFLDPNYFEDPRDMDDMVEGLKVCNRIGNSPQMGELGSAPLKTVYPGCERFVGHEDAYLRCLVTAVVLTASHSVGTARMGHPEDPRSVVDPHLRVKHIKGLRVVDASVMPVIPSGNTNVPTIMIAEKASDIIKATINCSGYVNRKKCWGTQKRKSKNHKLVGKLPPNTNHWTTVTPWDKEIRNNKNMNRNISQSIMNIPNNVTEL